MKSRLWRALKRTLLTCTAPDNFSSRLQNLSGAVAAVLVMLSGHHAFGDEPKLDRVFGGGTVEFGGHTWELKQGAKLGPAANAWLGTNVRLTKEGMLRLRIEQDETGHWTCAEARLQRPLGYGEYRWTITGDLDALDTHAVLGLFLYQDDAHEIDFELSRWAGRGDTWNGQFAIMPSEDDATMVRKGRLHRFDASGHATLTISLLWSQDGVRARCWNGEETGTPPLAEWSYAWNGGRNAPDPALAHCIMDLWILKGQAGRIEKPQEITVKAFAFTAEK